MGDSGGYWKFSGRKERHCGTVFSPGAFDPNQYHQLCGLGYTTSFSPSKFQFFLLLNGTNNISRGLPGKLHKIKMFKLCLACSKYSMKGSLIIRDEKKLMSGLFHSVLNSLIPVSF